MGYLYKEDECVRCWSNRDLYGDAFRAVMCYKEAALYHTAVVQSTILHCCSSSAGNYPIVYRCSAAQYITVHCFSVGSYCYAPSLAEG